jgi:hypothetical protein
MERIALISKQAAFDPAEMMPLERQFQLSGSNTGNNAFFLGIRKIVGGTHGFFDWNFDPDYINNNYDAAIFVSANHINGYSKFGNMPARIRKLKIPLFVVGIGAQALSPQHEITTNPSVDELLASLKDTAQYIGTRGEFTYKYLNKNGFSQAFVSGCPSNLISKEKNLGEIISNKFKNIDLDGRIALCIDVSRKFTNVSQKFQYLIENHACYVVCQDPLDLVYASFGEFDKIRPAYKETIMEFFGIKDDAAYKKFCAKYLHTFFDPTHLMHHAKSTQLSYGTKMHGNMLIFQSGTPAVTVAHDSRIHEMVEFLKLPRLAPSRLSPRFSLADDLSAMTFDGAVYDARRREQAETILTTMAKIGIPASPHLKELAGVSIQ